MMCLTCFFFFFFSSRRRHTRFKCDWSSDVCSSDLYAEPAGDLAPLEGHIAFYWNAVDAWYEEDEEVFVHPRDPYSRVDTVHSSRHVRVEVDGQVIANTERPVLLFETGLPTRYYIPKLDVRMDLLHGTDTVTHCPYKGDSSYWSFPLPDKTYPHFLS